ncbi:methylmalonyl Co-A mutase-associated GTPase MeaB [Amorphus orientalis]|uniref:LAO/AO transport system kinase n=1 Tax=Amorphus orientalis TaxID=649198 RepID=A0AAE3VRC5_9HYPH|nr:methylmalonyl Co-A mutase-associated GTPase MeaB [Amorphus orientalis]MDQ0317334.1 LAO/AO transport system kinase [Amorphus orientalis]
MTAQTPLTPDPSDEPEVTRLLEGLRTGKRAALARAITTVESSKIEHRRRARALLQAVLPDTGNGVRLGITGVPGVGKSTTIDAFGTMLTEAGHRVAVLAVDPSSTRTGGSILGDKTRMERLGHDPNAFIRPSPSAGTLGGVAARTRESMLLCEAAGYDVVIVETVGIGQSETAVAEMVDTFLVLGLPGAGDELQGIKKGVIEIADIIAVNKADGDNASRAKQAAAEYRSALQILTSPDADWRPPVLTISGATGDGLDRLWEEIRRHRETGQASGRFNDKRHHQQVAWMWTMIREQMMAALFTRPDVKARLKELESAVGEGSIAATVAADEIAQMMGLGEI